MRSCILTIWLLLVVAASAVLSIKRLHSRRQTADSPCDPDWTFFSNNGTSSCMKVVAQAGSWSQGEEACDAMGAHLATIYTTEQISMIHEMMKSASVDHVWTGAKAVGGAWTWADGSTGPVVGWGPGEPNNAGSGEECGEINIHHLNDYTCGASLPASLCAMPVLDESAGSETYIRWGRKVCPAESEVVYSGFAAGSDWEELGGGSNYVCLTESPTWDLTEEEGQAGVQAAHEWKGILHGSEYEIKTGFPFKGDNVPGGGPVTDHDVPCVACETVGRSSVVMIPGTYQCPAGWQEEYHGYMVAEHNLRKRTEFVCMDGVPEVVPDSGTDTEGSLFYLTVTACKSLKCPPYKENREVTCVVCSR